MSFVLPVYKKLNIDVQKTEGKYIWDTRGNKYIDFFSGLSVTNLGHRPPEVLNATKDVMSRYMHLSNLFKEENQELLAEEIIKRTINGKVFFSNSGAEANECAIKAARKYFSGERYEVISFINSFHGRTIATLAATGQKRYRRGFGPMPEGFVHAELNFLASVEDKISNKTCAVMVEPIQGEGGVIEAEIEFLQGLRKVCNDNNILLIADEIQTGMGRTGEFCAYQHYDIEPDIVCLGKALGGGLPLSATVLNEKVSRAFGPGDHGSTFGGNPVCCAAGLAFIKKIDKDLLDSVKQKGEYFISKLNQLKSMFRDIKQVRGKGLMIGMKMNFNAKDMVNYLIEKGYIANCTQESVIRFLPPYSIQKEDIDAVIEEMSVYLKERKKIN